jgi:L-amino acid N-acyltransferase
MDFRIADITDAKTVMEIYNEHIAAGNSTMDQHPKSLVEIEKWFNDFSARELIVMLENERKTIGWGIIKEYSDREGYAKACETAIYLKQSEIRQGYGTFLKKWVIEKCRELGYHHLVAKIFATNTASIAYNKKLGYELVGTQREIGFVDGAWQDVTIMQLILED